MHHCEVVIELLYTQKIGTIPILSYSTSDFEAPLERSSALLWFKLTMSGSHFAFNAIYTKNVERSLSMYCQDAVFFP